MWQNLIMDKTPQSELRLSDLSTLTTSTTNYVSFCFFLICCLFQPTHKMGSGGGGGLVVNVRPFNSDDPGSNLTYGFIIFLAHEK